VPVLASIMFVFVTLWYIYGITSNISVNKHSLALIQLKVVLLCFTLSQK